MLTARLRTADKKAGLSQNKLRQTGFFAREGKLQHFQLKRGYLHLFTSPPLAALSSTFNLAINTGIAVGSDSFDNKANGRADLSTHINICKTRYTNDVDS